MLGGTIRGQRVTLRTPRDDDLARINEWMADMRVRREGHLWGEPASPATWKERLAEAAKDRRRVVWTIGSPDAPVGYALIELGHDDPRHVGLEQLTIDPARWGQGLGTDAAMALHRYLFDYLDMRGCALDVAADNERALRLAEKIGYTGFGRGHDVYFRDGTYTDAVWLRVDRATWDARFPAEREYAPLPEGIER